MYVPTHEKIDRSLKDEYTTTSHTEEVVEENGEDLLCFLLSTVIDVETSCFYTKECTNKRTPTTLTQRCSTPRKRKIHKCNERYRFGC